MLIGYRASHEQFPPSELHHEISRVAGICENTLLSYVRRTRKGV
jgi:hypothetical protein